MYSCVQYTTHIHTTKCQQNLKIAKVVDMPNQ